MKHRGSVCREEKHITFEEQVAMGNVLSVYDPLFYAQEGLIALEKALGMAGRVYRGYDKSPQQKGSVISISIPSTFAAQDAPSTAQDIKTGEVQIALNFWREVKFALTDKELTFTTEKIINDHIRPAAYALADDIDQKLAALYKLFPFYVVATGPAAVADITASRTVLFNNKVPMDDLHMMLNGTLEGEFLNLAAFSQASGAGDAGVQTQMRGTLGQKFGFEVFANQNVNTHTGGACADPDGAIANAPGYAAGTKTINVDGLTAAGTVKVGDVLEITGHTQKYVITEDATANAGAITLKIEPGLQLAVTNAQVVKVIVGNFSESIGFHRNAIALAMAPLTEAGNNLGARISTITDPITGLALRSRIWYEGDDSTIKVALDVLYGMKVLNCNMGVRLRDAA
ncbi:MAG: hypothetical protein LAP85_24280 [Acidobacteriia bacterium]|nr:hypothetical protein [Terriglobia bacterium]